MAACFSIFKMKGGGGFPFYIVEILFCNFLDFFRLLLYPVLVLSSESELGPSCFL